LVVPEKAGGGGSTCPWPPCLYGPAQRTRFRREVTAAQIHSARSDLLQSCRLQAPTRSWHIHVLWHEAVLPWSPSVPFGFTSRQ